MMDNEKSHIYIAQQVSSLETLHRETVHVRMYCGQSVRDS